MKGSMPFVNAVETDGSLVFVTKRAQKIPSGRYPTRKSSFKKNQPVAEE